MQSSHRLIGALALMAASLLASPGALAVSSTTARPQLSSTAAAGYTISKYMAQAGTIGSLTTDNWDPTGGVGAISGFTANYKVAADGSASYTTIQAAINAAVSAGGTSRKYISVKAGTYKEVVCIPASAPPITLYGLDASAGNTVLHYNNSNLTPKATGTATSKCASNASATTVGTSDSASFTVMSKDFRARNLTFKNSYTEGSYSGSNQSALALSVRGDKAIFENVQVIGNQDTLFIGSTSYSTVIRAFFKSSFVQGDVDFIFGHGTAAFYGCTIQYTGARLGASATSYIFAPSTQSTNSYGFLVTNSTLNSTGSAGTGKTYLGRNWAQSGAKGQLVIRDTAISAHVRITDPWAAGTNGAAYSSSTARFWEYNNSGTGSGN
ncbi:pectinesterase family protein [Uliginosibacterium sp. TH139]|uniref:pectinesterase family protein n=1 Tax=Uliginosibacterium sp. TH139 TaxID=2067453 RepID=UPI000C7D47DA|nr:pectinesterase family protein [Uliginosibacterium sp. TH139]PLK48506.1 acyl-CoA thioesterase [Uliginosibacterium sp. TH139]